MTRWLLRTAALFCFVTSSVVACGADDTSGPPSAPCNDQTKGAAPICGKTCANKCGCGQCQPGTQTFIDSSLYVCSGGCFSLVSGVGGSTSTGGSGGGGSGGAAGAGGTGCQTVDCNATPPICGACTTCACCSCNNGQFLDIGGKTHVCNGGCFQPSTGDGG